MLFSGKKDDVIVIEVGSNLLRAAVFEIKDTDLIKKVALVEESNTGFFAGQVTNVREFKESVLHLIKKLTEKYSKKIYNPVFVLNMGHIFSSRVMYNIMLPQRELRTEDIADFFNVMHFRKEIKDNEYLMHVFVSDCKIDGFSLGNKGFANEIVGMRGNELNFEASLLCASSSLVNNLKNLLGEIGIANFDLVTTIYANYLSSSVHIPKECFNNLLMLDIGFSSTQYTLVHKGVFLGGGSIDFSNSMLNRRIAWEFDINEKDAEFLKDNYETLERVNVGNNEALILQTDNGINHIPLLKLQGIISKSLIELSDNIKSIIASHRFAQNIKDICLSGGGVRTTNITSLITQFLDMKFKVFEVDILLGQNSQNSAIKKEHLNIYGGGYYRMLDVASRGEGIDLHNTNSRMTAWNLLRKWLNEYFF